MISLKTRLVRTSPIRQFALAAEISIAFDRLTKEGNFILQLLNILVVSSWREEDFAVGRGDHTPPKIALAFKMAIMFGGLPHKVGMTNDRSISPNLPRLGESYGGRCGCNRSGADR